jgi:RNA polymerase sigma-70 factor (ECF subfamily)
MTNRKSYSDQEILSIAKADTGRAFEIAFDQYWSLLYTQAYRKTQSADLSKDLVQDVFIALWDNLEVLARQDSLLPYLYTILRNNVLKQFEKDSVRMKHAMKRTVDYDDFEITSHHLLLSKELQSIIVDEISKMPSRMKEIYGLKKEQNFSNKQIAEELGLSEQTVKNQLYTATIRLKERVKIYDPSLISLALLLCGLYYYTK